MFFFFFGLCIETMALNGTEPQNFAELEMNLLIERRLNPDPIAVIA
jgi:hypothetical protein